MTDLIPVEEAESKLVHSDSSGCGLFRAGVDDVNVRIAVSREIRAQHKHRCRH